MKEKNANNKNQRSKFSLRNSKPSNDSSEGEIKYVLRALTHMKEHARETKKRAQADHQWASRAITALSRLTKKGAIILLALLAISAHAEPRAQRNRNYILRRQQVYPGLGVPTSRLIIGRREIDVYRNGMMFERDHLVGVRTR